MLDSAGHMAATSVKVDVIERPDHSGRTIYGERYEGVVRITDFDHGEKYKVSCDACPTHGKNLACPPFSPSLSPYVDGAQAARVICLRLPLDLFDPPAAEDKDRAFFRVAKDLLTDELLEFREAGRIVAGSGACRACKTCAAELGRDRCLQPEKMIYSLESLGVNVVALVRDCFNIELEWRTEEKSAKFICAVGAVFEN